MKQKNSPGLLIVVGFLTFTLIALTYFIAYTNQNQDTTSEATTASDGISFQELENGEIISLTIIDANAFKMVCAVHKENSDIYEAERSIYKDTALGKFYYKSAPITETGNFYVYCQACLEEGCRSNYNSYTSDMYEVSTPYASVEIDDSTFCDDGEIYPRVADTNRSWFKYSIDSASSNVYKDFYDRSSYCIATMRYCDTEPFMAERGEQYWLNLYYCTQNCSESCDYDSDEQDAVCSCETTCSRLLDSISFKAPSCSGDLGIADLTVPATVAQNTSYNVLATIKNYSNYPSSSSKLQLDLYRNQLSTGDDVLETYTIDVSAISENAQTMKNQTFSPRTPGNYLIKATITDNSGLDENPSNNTATKEFTITSDVCNECPAGKYQTPDCQCVDCLSDSHCSNETKCDLSNFSCGCDLSCPEGMKVGTHCYYCVCASSCQEGQFQRSDCSCVNNSSLSETEEEYNKSKMIITSPADGSSHETGKNLILSYKFEGNYNFAESKTEWLVGKTSYEGKNGFVYELQNEGSLTIKLLYDNKEMDKVTILVGDEDSENLEDEGTEEKTVKDITWVVVCLGAVAIVVLIVSLVMLLSNMLKKDKVEDFDA